MGLLASISGLARSIGRALRRPGARHGDELTPTFFVRALEDRCVLSAVALPLQSVVNQLAVSAGRPQQQLYWASGGAVVSRQGQNINVSLTGGHQTIDIGQFQSSSAVNLTVRGDASDTVCFVGPLNLGGGKLDVMAGSIQVSGTLTSHGGSINLDAGVGGTLLVSGNIDVSNFARGRLGGSVELLGDRVGLLDQARVDVSGDAGGGTVLVGGDSHGANPAIADAQDVYVGAGVQITARSGACGRLEMSLYA